MAKKLVHKKSFFKGYLRRIKNKHQRIRFMHFVTHMLGKLLLGLGIGAFFFEQLQPSVVALIFVGLLMHIPFWHEVYFRR